MISISYRSVRWAILGVVALAGVLVTIDVGGPVRLVVTLVAVLVAPGLAASLSVEAMPADLRIVVSTVGSAALLAFAATVATLLGSSGSGFVFAVIGFVTVALVVLSSILHPDLILGASSANDAPSGKTGLAAVAKTERKASERRDHG